MLENGQLVFDCEVNSLLIENAVFQCYLVDCPDSLQGKLFLLRPETQFNDKQKKLFHDHTDRLIALNFSSVGVPLRVGEIEGQPACLYPSPPGESLSQTINARMTARQVIEFMEKINDSLSGPHSAEMCHGNLSPETIYVENSVPYLADFSLGQLFSLDYQSGVDPFYTSPEQVRGETASVAADVYSLGCLFYHLLTGQPPFSGVDPFAVAKQHLQGDFPDLPRELKEFQPLLESMVRTVIEERSSINDIKDQLSLLASQHGIDQIRLPESEGTELVESFKDDESVSLLDDAIGSSELAARIEARLKEHGGDFLDTETEDFPLGDEPQNLDDEIIPDMPVQEKKPVFWRFIMVLLLGILIGSGFYFLMNMDSLSSHTADEPVSGMVVKDLNADLDRGVELWIDGDLNGAEAVFKSIVADHQEDPRAYNNLAAFYAAQGNYDQARDFLEQALATNESYAAVYQNLGLIYAEMARGSYGRALQLDKAKAHLSLPVFSSLGILSLKESAGIDLVGQERVAKTAEDQDPAVDTERQPQLTKVVSTEKLSSADDTVVKENVATPVLVSKVVIPIKEDEQVVETADVEPPAIENVSVPAEVAAQETAEQFLKRWAQAWSTQDVETYLRFYDDQFLPPGGRTRSVWESQRYSRITAPERIEVALDGLILTNLGDGRWRVDAIQGYKSELLSDRTRKVFDLMLTDQGWTILRERSLGVIR